MVIRETYKGYNTTLESYISKAGQNCNYQATEILCVLLSSICLSSGQVPPYKDPIGILYCKDLCRFIVGCETYSYIVESLTCQTKLKDILSNVSYENCVIGSMVIIDRAKRQVCIPMGRIPKKQDLHLSETNKYLTPEQVEKLRIKGYKKIPWKKTIFYYKLYKVFKSYDDAMMQCQEDSGQLAQLKEDAKWNLLVDHRVITRSHKDYAWIGLRDLKRIDKFQWLDASFERLKDRWFTNQKHTFWGVEKNCCAVIVREKRLLVINFICTRKGSFICEASTSDSSHDATLA